MLGRSRSAKVAVTFMMRTGSAAVWADHIFSWNDALPTFLSHRSGPSPEKSVHFQEPILRTSKPTESPPVATGAVL